MSNILNKPRFKLFFILLLITFALSTIAGVTVNVVFGESLGKRQINSFMPNKLIIGSSFSLDEVVDCSNFKPLWIRSKEIEVHVFVEKKADNEVAYEETDELVIYSPSDRSFQINGVGSGIIRIISNIDKTVFVEFSYETVFQSNHSEPILRENFPGFFDDGIISNSEIQSVTEIVLSTSNQVNLVDFATFPFLKRVVLRTSRDIVHVDGIEALDNGVEFYVNNDLYYDYVNNESWAEYYNRLFPIVDLSKGKHTIVFEFNGGVMTKANKEDTHFFDSVSDGNMLDITNEYSITKVGHTFLGWYLSSDKGTTLTTKINDDYVFEKSTKLYASWVENEYDVCYKDRYSSKLPQTQHLRYTQLFHISDFIPNRTGYAFLGWSTEENSSQATYLPGTIAQSLTSVNNDVVNLFAIWVANNYCIKYDANGGTNAPNAQENISYGVNVQLSTIKPTRTGYTFCGWSINQNATEYDYLAGANVKNLVSNDEGVVTLYAIWVANSYSIVYDANNGSNAPVTQENLKYGETVSLTTDKPLRVGYVFLGWALNKSAVEPVYLPGASVKNLVSTSGGKITLYAVWQLATFYLKYDANGGEGSPNDDVLTYKTPGTVATVTPTRTGHTFKGWSVVKDGEPTYSSGALLNEAAVNSLYINGATLYAVWEVNYYTITVNSTGEKGGSVSGITNGGSYAYGTSLTITANYSGDENKYIQFNGTTVSNTYSFNMPACNVTITVHSDQSECIAAGSMITLSDGTQKEVEDLLETDELLVFDHQTGNYISAPILFIERDGWKDYSVINLVFSNGQNTKVIDEHAFFDLTLNKYVYIDCNNYMEFVGHEFAVYDSVNGERSNLVLKNAYVQVEYTGCFSLVTSFHMNYFVDGLFSMPGGIDGLFNIFEYDESMAYDSKKMQADIEKYGLYTYEDFEDYVSCEVFEYMFPAKYFKVAVGKGLITYDEILRLIDYYLVKHGFI